MKPLIRILAATDLSEHATHAVDRGFRIAADARAQFIIAHALELNALDSLFALLGDGTAVLKHRLESEAREALERMAADPAHTRGVSADIQIVSGAPVNAIADLSVAIDAGLLVLGARGASFLRHMTIGTTASRLLRKAVKCPVLVVKNPPVEAYRRLLIPVDFSPTSLNAISFGRQLAPAADIALLHAFELPFEGKLTYAGVENHIIQHYIRTARDEYLQQLHQLAKSAGLTASDYTAVVIHGDPSQQIISQEQGCDLIIMGKHGLRLTEELLLGSVTQHILAESQCDILMLTDSRKPEVS